MINILRMPDDDVNIKTSNETLVDATVRFNLSESQLDVYLTAKKDKP